MAQAEKGEQKTRIDLKHQLRETTAQRLSAGLALLLDAHEFSQDVQSPNGEFHTGYDELLAVGLCRIDLHWLVAKGHLAAANGKPHKPAKARRESSGKAAKTGRFTPRSTFVLTNQGKKFAEDVIAQRCAVCGAERNGKADVEHTTSTRPVWDVKRRTLHWGSKLVKHYRVHANNQVAILTAFEEQGWPPCIRNPLTATREATAQRRLHDAITRLNGRQIHRCLVFGGNGTAEGITWRALD